MSLYYDEIERNYKDHNENLMWRISLRQQARKDPVYRKALLSACREDVLFFFNSFAWVYEPRDMFDASGAMLPKKLPFLTWPHQDKAIRDLEKNLGVQDIGIEKSRAQGASWVVMTQFLHAWLFLDRQAFGVVSKTELDADNPDNPDSLMWKADNQLLWLPKWMIPEGFNPNIHRSFTKHVLTNPRTHSTIAGFACTGNVGSGGRKRAFLMDEFAKHPRGPDKESLDSTQQVTKCRIFLSSPFGQTGAYYDVMHDNSSMVKIILDWNDNPTQNRGLYTVVDDKPQLLEPRKNPFPKEHRQTYVDPVKWNYLRGQLEIRGYDLKRGVRSPWFDAECLRAGANPRSIAQELCRDYGGSVSRFFPVALIEKLLAVAKTPTLIGELHWDDAFKPDWRLTEAGKLRLWCKLDDVFGRPPRSVDYIVSCDIGNGTGGTRTSNSVATVTERTGTKVGELASPLIPPHTFAEYAIALCKWFQGPSGEAWLIWERNGGAGAQFSQRVKDSSFRNFYKHRREDRMGRPATDVPGFTTQRANKPQLLGNYQTYLTEGYFRNPCKEALEECLQYVHEASGRIVHEKSNIDDDPSGAGENHGDRVIADALAAWGLRELSRPQKERKLKPKHQVAPPGSWQWRREQWDAKQRDKRWTW